MRGKAAGTALSACGSGLVETIDDFFHLTGQGPDLRLEREHPDRKFTRGRASVFRKSARWRRNAGRRSGAAIPDKRLQRPDHRLEIEYPLFELLDALRIARWFSVLLSLRRRGLEQACPCEPGDRNKKRK